MLNILKKYIIPLILIGVLLTGCSAKMLEKELESLYEETEISNILDVEETKSVSIDDVLEKVKSSKQLFYFNKLNEEEKIVYSEIYYILENFEEDVAVSTLDPEMVDKVFSYVMYDHPEIFYADGYTYTRYLVSNEPTELTFTGSYTMTSEEAEDYKIEVDAYYDRFLEELTASIESVDDYEIIKFIYEYIIAGTEYDKESKENQNILSVMLYGRSVCSGYTKTAQYLMNKCGIESTIVIGEILDGEAHSWNLVKSNGNYYYMDATWGDSSYTLKDSSEEFKNSLPPINYNYMLMPYAEIEDTHIFANKDLMPECNVIYDNYFVKEGYYFENADDDNLFRYAFDKAYSEGDEYIMLKCRDEEAYEEVVDYLLGEQRIFAFLHNDSGTVAYAENPLQYYLIFWL